MSIRIVALDLPQSAIGSLGAYAFTACTLKCPLPASVRKCAQASCDL